MKKLVVLTGAGISAESGLKTFRDSGGLWEGYDVSEVATPEGWKRNRQLVLDFYNERRRQLKAAEPNDAHKIISELQDYFNVTVITQNVDDLHEKAGTKKIIHLHGKLTQARSSIDEGLIYDIGYKDICIGDKCERGSQIRPNIVWFGEAVPEMNNAELEVSKADVLIICGTSMVVYPAAGLLYSAPQGIPVYVVDPVKPDIYDMPVNITFIEQKASVGMKTVKEQIINL